MDPSPATPAAPAVLPVVFFGLGAVGSSMLICLAELAERDEVPLRFVVVVQEPELARDALFHAEWLFDRIDFITALDFDDLFRGDHPGRARLEGARLLVNAAHPRFNQPILELGLAIGAHAVARAKVSRGERALVVGSGPIGVGVAIFAGLAGAEVTVIDSRADRLNFATQHLAVPQAIMLGEGDAGQMQTLTGGEFYTHVFDCTGSPKAMAADTHG